MALFIEGREFNDYKEFVTEIEDLQKETFCKFILKGAKTIEAKNRELSTDKIQYAAKFVYASLRFLTASKVESQSGRGKGLGRIGGESEVGIHTTHNRHIILY